MLNSATTSFPAVRIPRPPFTSAPAHHAHANHMGVMTPTVPAPGLRIPFFVREIYKNGFLKRLPHNERKSSPISKLMKSDRFWVVFSVHDDVHPFLELWNDPTEVAVKPPMYVYPLAVCQHISPSLIPADAEWSFVVNFETVAIRFACNSRETMEEWVDCLRNKLGDMGILNPRGNLYSKTPIATSPPKVSRNPMSPLPSPPVSSEQPNSSGPVTVSSMVSNESRNRLSIVDASDQSNQTFTTSIYLNQSPPNSPERNPSCLVNTTNKAKAPSLLSLESSESNKGYETINPSTASVQTSIADTTTTSSSSVYLNRAVSPARHVTVIPINNQVNKKSGDLSGEHSSEGSDESRRRRSPVRKPRPLSLADDSTTTSSSRRSRYDDAILSYESKKHTPSGDQTKRATEKKTSNKDGHARIRKKSQRSSSLGPLLDENNILVFRRMANTNSLESIDSNPRQAANTRVTQRNGNESSHLGAIPRRHHSSSNAVLPNQSGSSSAEPIGSEHNVPGQSSSQTTRKDSGSGPTTGSRLPNPYSVPGFPPHLPLPGLTCQLSLYPPPPPPPSGHPQALPGPPPPTLAANSGDPAQSAPQQQLPRSLREQQVLRLRQEIAHPGGVRLVLRIRDCQHSLALVELFGCLWVAGWKQKEFPVLYNAFHVGDQIVSVNGIPARSVNDFHKALKQPHPLLLRHQQQPQLHVEIIIRRMPFAQVFNLRREIDGQPVGIVTASSTPEIRDVVPNSPASNMGMTSAVRSLDMQTLVPWVITEINGRPLSLFAKDNEASERLRAVGREISVLVQPADFLQRLRKNMKSIRGYKDYIMG